MIGPASKSFLVRAASLLVLLQACECGEELYSVPGRIEGRACDEHTGAPLPSGQARFESGGLLREAGLDRDGRFVLDRLPAGAGVLLLPGADGERSFDVVVKADEDTRFVDTACRQQPPPAETGRVEGEVCDRHVGDVVVGATVSIPLPDGSTAQATTDDEGRFALDDVPVGDHVLQVRATGYQNSELVTVQAGETTIVDVGERCSVPVPVDEEPGAIAGRVCAPDGETWLAGASVWVEPDEGRIETLTDGEGRFLLADVPAGQHTVFIEKGSFTTTHDVVVTPGETTQIPEEECALVPELRIAVVYGSQYDDVYGVLLELGIDASIIDTFHSTWADQLLGDYAAIAQYDILFLNCRAAEPSFMASAVYQQNLRRFVEEGGSLHASDQAYDLIEKVFPDKIDFHGDDAVHGSADQGDVASALPATVVDPVLQAALGTDTVPLKYGLTTWSAMTGVGPGVHVYLRADSPLLDGSILYDAPHSVGFAHGQGRVVYSSFHEEPGIGALQQRVLQLLMFEL